MSTLSSLRKNHPGLKVRQAKNTNIWLPNCHVNYYLSVKVIKCYAYVYGMPVETETMMNRFVYINIFNNMYIKDMYLVT